MHTDHLGTPRKVTDDAGKVAWQWAYSAFGDNKPTGPLKSSPKVVAGQTINMLKATQPTVMLNLRFPGQYWDDEAKLSYNYFRSYQPGQGRYTQPDPIGLDGGDNRFAYVGGSPLSFIDPKGLQVVIVIPKRPGGRVDPDFPLGVGPNHQSDSVLQDLIERGANRSEYKNACDEQPPPGLNHCERAKWELKKWRSCKALREANTNKWWGGQDTQHDVQMMTDIEINISNAERAVRRMCKEECP